MKVALQVKSDGSSQELDITENSLAVLQAGVDGLIQPIDIREDLTMWVNEEFLFRGDFEPNLLGTSFYQSVYGTDGLIHGPIVFTGGSDEAGNTLPLSDSMLVKLRDKVDMMNELLGMMI
jgi:hypothetical protein